MRRRHHFFPHNLRKKTARISNQVLKFCFLFFVFCFLFLNLHSSLFPENEKLGQAKKEVLTSPFKENAHINLAKVYLEMGNLKATEQELSLAKTLTHVSSGFKSVEQALKKAKEKPQKIRQEISFWQEVIKEKPGYRDAYFQLAVLNYQIYEYKEAKKYLQKTLELDPNFTLAKELQKLLPK